MNEPSRHPASFKDPAGFIFIQSGIVYRQVNHSYARQYDHLLQSGLYQELVTRRMLISHEEVPGHQGLDGKAFKVLRPEQLKVISYPYEWSFDMLKDAALLTLQINQLAMEHGMILKDAAAFNLQFLKGKPLFIDTLSFEIYEPSSPWIAYRQFCKHFLFPLLLTHYHHKDAIRWGSLYLDGLPVELTASLLPFSTRFRLDTVLHVHLQNRLSKKSGDRETKHAFSKEKMKQLLSHLASVINGLRLRSDMSGWNDYYDNTILSRAYLEEKEQVFRQFITDIQVSTALDLGANNGYFSNILAASGIEVTAVDSDYIAINDLYRALKSRDENRILPMVMDLSNPSPDLGWAHVERMSFTSRFQPELVLALALVHHLYFVFNIPLHAIIAQLASSCTEYCIVEFVLSTDEKVKFVSASRKELLDHYTMENFELGCNKYFSIQQKKTMTNANRILYLLKKTT